MAEGGEWQVVDRRAKGPERSAGSPATKATRKPATLSPKEQYGACAAEPPGATRLAPLPRAAPAGRSAHIRASVHVSLMHRSPLCSTCRIGVGSRYKTEHALLRRKIFVGGIGPLGERDISAFFSKHGEIESVEVLRGRDKQPRGFSFIIFKKAETVDKLVAIRFFEIGNRAVEVRPTPSVPCDEPLSGARGSQMRPAMLKQLCHSGLPGQGVRATTTSGAGLQRVRKTNYRSRSTAAQGCRRTATATGATATGATATGATPVAYTRQRRKSSNTQTTTIGWAKACHSAASLDGNTWTGAAAGVRST